MNKDDNKKPQFDNAHEAYKKKKPFFINTEQTKKEQNKQVNPNPNNANDKSKIPPTHTEKK